MFPLKQISAPKTETQSLCWNPFKNAPSNKFLNMENKLRLFKDLHDVFWTETYKP